VNPMDHAADAEAAGQGAAAGFWQGLGLPEPAAGPEHGLTEADMPADPVDLLQRWLADAVAAGLPEPNAMALATVSGDGRPRARMVLLKGLEDGALTFYTNRGSRKAADLAEVPRACLMFPWQALHRQVIVEATVTPMSTADSEPYFRSRPRGSQLGAWASRQSTVIGSRAELEARFAELAERWPEGTQVPMPDFWGGYRAEPVVIEFWHGRTNRLHDRFRYSRQDDGWLLERLAP
jgi:pyridoxamine 5'-phosphate oxidase